MLGHCITVCRFYKTLQYDGRIIVLGSRTATGDDWNYGSIGTSIVKGTKMFYGLGTLNHRKPQELRLELKHPSWGKKKSQTTMTLFFYHEVKVVLINYLYPGTFVKQKNVHIGIK